MKFLASLELLRPPVLDLVSLVEEAKSSVLSASWLCPVIKAYGSWREENVKSRSYSWTHKQWEATLSPGLKQTPLHFRMENLSSQDQNRNLSCPLMHSGQDLPLSWLCLGFTDLSVVGLCFGV